MTATAGTTHLHWKIAAKAYGDKVGIVGRAGGWLYTPDGQVICHGWASLVGLLIQAGALVDPDGCPLHPNPLEDNARHRGPLKRNVFDRKPVVLTHRLRRGDAQRYGRALAALTGPPDWNLRAFR